MLKLRNQIFIRPKIHSLYIEHVNIGKIVISDEFPVINKSSKYLINYIDNGEVMSRYLFLVDDEKLWKTYNKIWSELNVTIGKNIYKDQVFEKKYMKTKIKSYNNTITEDFNGKAPTDGIKWICLSAIVINSVVKLGKNYYSQTFLEECKYKIKETEKIINLR